MRSTVREPRHSGTTSARSTILALVAAIGLIGLGLPGTATPGVEAAGGATLTLAPDHGFPWESFQATFTAPPLGSGACSDFAEITWDGVTLKDTGRATLVAGACQFTVTLAPPSGKAAPGPHDLGGSACVVVGNLGTCDPATAARATYTIDTATITVSPSAGVPGAAFDVTYGMPAGDCSGMAEAQFLWNGPGGPELGRATFDPATCIARLAGAVIPTGSTPGPNAVSALACFTPTYCDPATAPVAGATYVVQVPATIAVSPLAGDGATPFTAVYTPSSIDCSYGYVRFGWDGTLDPAWTTALDTATCAGSMDLTPPAGAATGDHQVTAVACRQLQGPELTCDAWTAPQVPATYSIALPPAPPVLSIAKTSDVTTAPAGGEVAYDITLSVLNGPMAGVSIVDQLPAAMGGATGVSAGGTYSAATNQVTWTDVAVTDGQRLTYRAFVSSTASPAAGPLVNTATVVAGPCEICSASASLDVTSGPTFSPSPGSRSSPSPVPSASASPSASSSPSALPSGTVEGITGSPEPTGQPGSLPDGPGSSSTPSGGPGSVLAPPTGAPAANPLLPAFTASIPGPLGLSFDPSVVATNLALTLLFVFLFGLTAEIFNSTIDEHREEIEAWWQRLLRGPLRVLAPVTKLDAAFDGLTEAGRLGAMAHGMGIVLVIGMVYGLLSSDFGINEQSLILIASLMIGAGFVTYLNYGGKSLLIRRRHNAHSVVRLYGTAVLVAIVCVLATRVIGFHPGIIYGFMASTVILTPVALARRDEARLVLMPAAVLLLVSLLAWLFLIPVDAAGDNPGFGVTLLKAVLTIVFIGGLEGLLFNLLPIRYMDGAKVMAWSRPAWAIAFGLITFLWWQLLLNRDRAYVDALTQTSVGPVIAVLIFFVLTTGTVWTFFRIRDQRRLQEGEA